MKKLLITLAVLGAYGGAAQAQSNVTIYGILDSFVEIGNNGQNNITKIQTGGTTPSRIGFRGQEDLGGGLKAVWNLENGANVDDGTAAQGGILFGRQAVVGLTGNFGSVTLGRQYTPLFMTHVLFTTGAMGWGTSANYWFEGAVSRATNSVQYVTPNMSGFSARVLYALGENSTPGMSTVGNAYSASGTYTTGALSLNLSYMSRKTTLANTDDWKGLGASYDFKVAKVGLLYTQRRDDAKLTRNNYWDLSAAVPVTGGALMLDIGGIENKVIDNAGAISASIRYDYTLSKRTIVYGGFSTVRNDDKARYGVAAAAGVPMVVAAGNNSRAFALGVRHSF
ncbi:MAG: porin [Telluria sp.]|nr:porin [Telluria sp.]